jgi:hypothetical protein
MGARWENGQGVIRVNLRNLRTIEKAGTKGPLITLITLIMDVRNLSVARACGKWARDGRTGGA